MTGKTLDMNDQLREAANILRLGGLVVFPTETVYGLGADAFNARAVARIFEVKGRPRLDPLIVHISRRNELASVVLVNTAFAEKLADAFWPGPLTMVLPKRIDIPDIVTAGLPTVAIRMPSHATTLQLIELCGRPIAAPSANLFGHISPTTAAHVRAQLFGKLDLILAEPVPQTDLGLAIMDRLKRAANHPAAAQRGG